MSYKTENVFELEIISKIRAIKKIILTPNKSATKVVVKFKGQSKFGLWNIESKPEVEIILYDVIHDVVSSVNGKEEHNHPTIPKEEISRLTSMLEKELKRVNLPAKRLAIEKKNYMKNLQTQITGGLKYGLKIEELVKLYNESITKEVLSK